MTRYELGKNSSRMYVPFVTVYPIPHPMTTECRAEQSDVQGQLPGPYDSSISAWKKVTVDNKNCKDSFLRASDRHTDHTGSRLRHRSVAHQRFVKRGNLVDVSLLSSRAWTGQAVPRPWYLPHEGAGTSATLHLAVSTLGLRYPSSDSMRMASRSS